MRPESCSSTVARQELEDIWRLKVEETYSTYLDAAARCRDWLADNAGGLTVNLNGPLSAVRQAEVEALAEYVRVLKIFSELTIHGRIPEEQEAVSEDSERP